MSDPKKSINLSEAISIVQGHFREICCGFLTFTVLGSIDDKRVPYIAIRLKEHCLLENEFRVHDVIVNRDGTIYATKFVGIDGKGEIPAFTGK